MLLGDVGRCSYHLCFFRRSPPWSTLSEFRSLEVIDSGPQKSADAPFSMLCPAKAAVPGLPRMRARFEGATGLDAWTTQRRLDLGHTSYQRGDYAMDL